jgi:hypothetical protein
MADNPTYVLELRGERLQAKTYKKLPFGDWMQIASTVDNHAA